MDSPLWFEKPWCKDTDFGLKVQKESGSEGGWLQAPPVVELEEKQIVSRELEGISYVLCE